MSQPIYLPKLETTVDGYVDSNTSIAKQVIMKRNSAGGAVFEHILLPNNSGGSVGIGSGAGSNGIITYNTIDAIIPNMALVFNSFGGTVTPNFTNAILSPHNQTNFVGVAKTATTTSAHNWIQLPISNNQPGARMYHAMVYIPSAQVHILHGGLGTNSSQIYGDTLLWNGQNWSAFLGGGPTGGRYGQAITVDTKHHSNATSQNLVLIFGGSNAGGRLNETWYYDGQTWGQLSPGSSPSARVHAAMSFNEANNFTVLFGGYTGSVNGDTWTLDLTDFSSPVWTNVSPMLSPPARFHHSMCYDSVRQRTILFGGTDGYTAFNDTWEWDGTSWHLIQLANSPPPRIDASIAYDPVNKVVVLFGGYLDTALNMNNTFAIYSDVWYYDGTAWTQQLFFGPSARAGAAVSFDKAKNYLFLFGGANAGTTRDLVFNNPETVTYQDSWELLTLTNQVDVQTIGTPYVYWDATDLLTIAPGGLIRGSDTTTVTVASKLPHNFITGNQFSIHSPGDLNFSAGNYTVTAILDANHFTYTNSGAVTSSTVDVILEVLGPGSVGLGAEVPTINRFLGAGGIPGTVTPNGFGSTSDGYSPIFGIVAEAPAKDSSGAVFQTLIGENRVGLVKIKTGAFYGFIAGLGPQIRYVTPLSGPIGTQVRIIGNGLNTTTQVTYGDDAYGNISGAYQVISANQIDVTIPPGAQTYGQIGVQTSIGAIFKPFTVTPKINSITASSHAIGNLITISGTTFALAAGIGSTYPAIGVSPSTLSFTKSGGTIILPLQTTIAVGSNGQNLPQAIISVASTTGFETTGTIYITTTAGTQSVTYTGIAGNTFTGCSGGTGTMATGNRVLLTFTVVNNNTIQALIPTGAISGPITLTTPDGSTSLNFNVLPPPTISLIAPLGGSPSQQIAITGTGFTVPGAAGDGYGILQFKAGSQFLPVGSAIKTVYNDTTMTVTVPSMPGGQGSTSFNLQLSNTAGTVISSQQFTIAAAPTFLDAGLGLAITTLNGSINSSVATIVLTSATNFPTSGSTFIDNEQISFTGKSGNSLTGCVRGINGTTAVSHSNGATVQVLTFISENNNSQGIAGTLVRIFGQFGFTGVSSVSFGPYEAASYNFVNDGYITAVVPNVISSSDVDGAITVISTGGIANTSASYTNPNTFKILQTPVITSIFNSSHITANAQSGKTGDIVTVSGTNFFGVTDVRFAGMVNSASFTVINYTTINVTVPANDGYIVVAPSNGVITIKKSTFFTASSSQNFTYYPPAAGLTLTSPTQDTGGDNFHANGGYGTNITLTGTNLNQGGSPFISISFGGISIAPGSAAPTVLSAIVPSGANNGLTLTTAGGTTGSITFNVLKPVAITSINTGTSYLGQWYATPLYPTQIDVFGANFRDSTHMTIQIQDPARGYAVITITSFTFFNSGHVRFDASTLTAFSGNDLCSIIFTTFFPGGSYTYTLNNAFVCYFPIT